MRITPQEFCRLAKRLMSHPAVPYHEHAVRTEVEAMCEEEGLRCTRDGFGNLFLRLENNSRARPLVLAAHMDHPGFEIKSRSGARRWRADFMGGVPDSFFKRGTPVRLMPMSARGKLGKRLGHKKQFNIETSIQLDASPEYAVWDIPDFQLRAGKIRGRACDDLIGVAAIVATMMNLKRTRARCNVIGLISRAEEVGFHGALAAASAKSLPRTSLVISLETSRELPGVRMGDGVILRAGDRASIFNSRATRYLSEVATELSCRAKFRFQRALMSGGTCEATAYQEFGFQTAAVCVALGNYHNCGRKNRIAAEYVSLADALSMVELLNWAARRMGKFESFTGRLPKRLENLLRKAVPRLLRNP